MGRETTSPPGPALTCLFRRGSAAALPELRSQHPRPTSCGSVGFPWPIATEAIHRKHGRSERTAPGFAGVNCPPKYSHHRGGRIMRQSPGNPVLLVTHILPLYPGRAPPPGLSQQKYLGKLMHGLKPMPLLQCCLLGG